MTDYQKFDTLQAFLAHCADGEANGTGAPRTDFVMSVANEPIGPEAGRATMPVITIHPHGFEHMAQRFAFDLTGKDALIANDKIEAKRAYLLAQAVAGNKAQAAAAQVPAGVTVARIADPTPPTVAPGSGQ